MTIIPLERLGTFLLLGNLTCAERRDAAWKGLKGLFKLRSKLFTALQGTDCAGGARGFPNMMAQGSKEIAQCSRRSKCSELKQMLHSKQNRFARRDLCLSQSLWPRSSKPDPAISHRLLHLLTV